MLVIPKGWKIREVMVLLGLTISALGRLAGVKNQATIRRVLRSLPCTIRTFLKITDALEIPRDRAHEYFDRIEEGPNRNKPGPKPKSGGFEPKAGPEPNPEGCGSKPEPEPEPEPKGGKK